MKLIPAILTSSQDSLVKQISKIIANPPEDFDDLVQIDIIDGEFAPNLTLSAEDLIEIDFQHLTIDLHLMTNEPMDQINEILEFKKHLPLHTIIAQIERMSSPEYYLEELRKNDLSAGISLDLYTPIEEIKSEWFDLGLSTVQFMAVEAGFQGQVFNSLVIEKLQAFTDKFSQEIAKCEDFQIIIDGGINAQLYSELSELDFPPTALAVGTALSQF